jgi:hypothetical protein
MTDKSLKVYVGDDRLPVHDLTDYVDWPDSRFIGQAYNGESSVSSVVFRDENARFGPWVDSPVTIAVRNEVEVLHGSNFLYRGRWIGRTWERGVQKAYQAREVTAEAEDVNVELRGLIVDGWVRPVETDRARVLALREDYLDGSVRPGSNLATTYVSSSNTLLLPAKTYERTDPLGVLQDVAFQTHKQFFVTIDKQLFYDGWDSGAYVCPFRISDDEADLRTSPTITLGIVPDSGPLFAINGQRFIDGIRLYYGAGTTDYVDVTHPGLSSAKAHWRETVYAPESITNATEAANLAETILQERSQDGRTFMLSVCHANGGPLTDAQVGSIKPGMLISIKARVLPFFFTSGQPNYAYYSTRIVSLQWHMPLPGQYFATLKLERPERTFGVGVKPGPQPPGGATVASCTLDVGQMTAISTPNGGFETGLTTHWTFNAISHGLVGPATGAWEGSYYYGLAGAGYAVYQGWSGFTFTAGTNYVVRWQHGGSATATVRFGLADETDMTEQLATSGADWATDCIEWTPASDADAADVFFAMVGTGAPISFNIDNVRLYTGGSGDVPADVGGSGDPGDDTGTYSPIDHVHGHGTHTADYHTNYVQENILTMAGDVPYATGASTWTRLAIGSSNFHLRSDGTKPVWSPESPALTNPMDAVGDLIRGGTAGAPTKLAIGASNFALKSSGTIPEWSNTLRLSYIDLDEHTLGLPPSPPAGAIRLYGSNSKGYYENSGGTVVELGGAGGGVASGVTVQDEGTPLATDGTTLNFVGAGVTATGAGATKTITIPGGGSGGDPFPINVAPGSAHGSDDEFSDTGSAVPGGWTEITTSQTGAYVEGGGVLLFEPSGAGTASTGSRGAFGIRKNSPTGSFTISARLADRYLTLNDNARVGIFVARTTGTVFHHVGHVGAATSSTVASTIRGTSYSESADWGAYDGVNTVDFNPTGRQLFAGLWYRIVWNSGAGSIAFYFSMDGLAWEIIPASTITGQSQPDRMGVAIYSNSTDIRANHGIAVDWFRVTEP